MLSQDWKNYYAKFDSDKEWNFAQEIQSKKIFFLSCRNKEKETGNIIIN